MLLFFRLGGFHLKRFLVCTFLITGGTSFFISGCGKKASDSAPVAASAGYHCPMHPTYTSKTLVDCPLCGMKLVPINPEESPVARSGDRSAVQLSDERQKLAGVRTGLATRRSLESLIRTTARAGYEPDLLNKINEYRQAVRAQNTPQAAVWPEAYVQAAAERLKQMGLSKEQIDRLAKDADNPMSLLLEGLTNAMWVTAQVYEHEGAMIRAGQTMDLTSSAFPGQTMTAKIAAVDTLVNPATRTLRVRAGVADPDHRLKSDMYLDAVIHVTLGKCLSVPDAALIDTGTRKLVFVEAPKGQFSPREVTTGRDAEGYVEILSGVREGDTVVTSANFLIDSESRLKAALSQRK